MQLVTPSLSIAMLAMRVRDAGLPNLQDVPYMMREILISIIVPTDTGLPTTEPFARKVIRNFGCIIQHCENNCYNNDVCTAFDCGYIIIRL